MAIRGARIAPPSAPAPRRAAVSPLLAAVGSFLGLAVVAVAAAHAQPQAQPSPGGSRPARSVRHTQANADRVILAPTAETHPEGAVFASAYDIVVVQAGYAPSERLHVSLAGLATGEFVELNVKANVLRSRYLRVAALSAIDYARADDSDEDDAGAPDLVFGRVGGTLQLCFELRCRSSLSLSAMVAVHDESDTVLPLGASAGLTSFVVEEVSLLLEYSGLFNAARDLAIVDLPVHLLAYGARFSSNAHWALDVTLVRALSSDDEVRVASPGVFDFLGVPLLAFTYRFLR